MLLLFADPTRHRELFPELINGTLMMMILGHNYWDVGSIDTDEMACFTDR